jgi:DNA-binding transcriptional LysR family regulator
MDINFELYKVFYYVAKNTSFSEASSKLFISQSAVSQSIKLLEEKLNAKLFFRNTKQVKLTHEGELLFQHIEQAFNFIKTGERTINEIHSFKHGEVRIGATDTICKYYLLPYLTQFHQLYPHIKIHITNRTSPHCMELLKKGSVDVCVVNIREKELDSTLAVQKTTTIQDVFIANNKFIHLKNRVVNFDELHNYPLLMLEKNTTTRNFLDNFLKQQKVKLVPEIELGNIDLLVDMAKIGLGIAFVVKDYIEEELKAGTIFPIKLQEELPPRQIGVLTNKKVPVPIAAEKFIELL